VLTPINEDELNSPGNTVAEIVIDGSITDVDVIAGSPPEAIAVTWVDNSNGRWQFATGSGWNGFSASSGTVDLSTAAVLLDSGNSIRFVPDSDWNGVAALKFRAWDKSSGTAGETLDVTATGSSGPVSVEEETASVLVNAVNDVPSFTSGSDIAVNENSGAYSAAWASVISRGPANESGQTLTFLVSNDFNTLFEDQPSINAAGRRCDRRRGFRRLFRAVGKHQRRRSRHHVQRRQFQQ